MKEKKKIKRVKSGIRKPEKWMTKKWTNCLIHFWAITANTARKSGQSRATVSACLCGYKMLLYKLYLKITQIVVIFAAINFNTKKIWIAR